MSTQEHEEAIRKMETMFASPDSVTRNNHRSELETLLLNDKWDVLQKDVSAGFPDGKTSLTVSKKEYSHGVLSELTKIAGQANAAEKGMGDVSITEKDGMITITMEAKVLESMRGAVRRGHEQIMRQGHSKISEQPGGDGSANHGLPPIASIEKAAQGFSKGLII
jgi:hypothetical protein